MKTSKKNVLDSYNSAATLTVNGQGFRIYKVDALSKAGVCDVSRLPRTLKILLENLLRNEDGDTVTTDDILAFGDWLEQRTSTREIAFRPGRVLMQDFTGVPAVADLAAMRDAVAAAGGDPQSINPQIPVDLVIDHSVQVDSYGSPESFQINVEREMERNRERYAFLRWGQNAFDNFRVVPPGTGICHQVNLEYLARVVWRGEGDSASTVAYPDTLLGTDSHTTMINGLGVLGWGVGGIEAEAAMLGQPVSMTIPDVVGVRLEGKLLPGVTATDLVLTITELLRKTGVVGKFVEFYGPGLDALTIADRATIANMSPEYGATCGYFPIDAETIKYLRFTGREEVTALVELYAKEQGLWRDAASPDPVFTNVVVVALAEVVPCVAGPKRPQDRVPLTELPAVVAKALPASRVERKVAISDLGVDLRDGDVVIAAITSCTNTSNPTVMLAAALLAKKAVAAGLTVKPWVKTSLAPGSKVVMEYLRHSGLYESLVALGFDLVGYGCTTCIGNSGPLPKAIENAIVSGDLAVSAVLSGNRNFEGRIHPQAKLSWLASPPLVVAFALAGTTRIDLASAPLGVGADGRPVYLKDIWPSQNELQELVGDITPEMFRAGYGDLYDGTPEWQALENNSSPTYPWDAHSSYVKQPPFLQGGQDGKGTRMPGKMRVLALFGDSITTDHISPAGNIAPDSPAGLHLQKLGVAVSDFNSYGSRRGNHDVMVRGTFANIRIKNEMTPEREGGFTVHHPAGERMTIFDAAERYRSEGVPLIIVAGKEYGSGSSRDWAAKGPLLLGVRAVIAESFERIHRSNLIGMGILPLQLMEGENRKTIGLDGSETIELKVLEAELTHGVNVTAKISRCDGTTSNITLKCRLDTANEVAYFKAGGILQYVLAGYLAR
ncbi:MAG: aconitate hydratase AcnA [Desulfuromonadaceae bacterium]|nr:aconitate hydratase AcnA [Desulfuromonadaceae bacterium]MDD2848832.1 aconitate hydratase AcnA [Desulfuromonadaceae bacterium]MDD4132211.1 aconitate hydratase AcnA [Desulfuromonadaceae bacterium]